MSENITINWRKRILAYPLNWSDEQIYVAYMNYMDEYKNMCKEMDDGPYRFWTDHERKTSTSKTHRVFVKEQLWRFIPKND